MNQNILQQKADAILDTPVPIRIPIHARNKYESILQDLNIKPKEKIFHVRPLCLGSLIKISRVMLGMDISVLKDINVMESSYRAIAGHADAMIRVVAIALVNREEDPPQDLLDLVRREFTSKDLATTLSVILSQMNISSFLNTIISVRGLNVLAKKEVSPIDQGSQIASGESLVEL